MKHRTPVGVSGNDSGKDYINDLQFMLNNEHPFLENLVSGKMLCVSHVECQ